jgi:hypothetical protein
MRLSRSVVCSPVAALRYQHATVDRDRALTDAPSDLGRKAVVMPLQPEDPRPNEETESELPRGGRAMVVLRSNPKPAPYAVIVPLTRGNLRADDGIRTRDPHLGKVMLYQLSHVRVRPSP